MDDGLDGNEDSLLVSYRLVEGVDGRVIQPRRGANGFGKLSRSNGRDKDLDLALELLMFCQVEATEGGEGPQGRAKCRSQTFGPKNFPLSPPWPAEAGRRFSAKE